jgi:hypothetical protein
MEISYLKIKSYHYRMHVSRKGGNPKLLSLTSNDGHGMTILFVFHLFNHAIDTFKAVNLKLRKAA